MRPGRALSGLAIVGFVFLVGATSDKTTKEIRANRFVADKDGKTRAELQTELDGVSWPTMHRKPSFCSAMIAVLGVLLSLEMSAPVGAHHVGVFIPKDDNITKNFKDIKFASQAGRFDVALKLFDDGIVHATMEKREQSLPGGLEDGLRASLKAKDLPGVELRLTIFLAFMTKERVRDAIRKLENPNLSSGLRREHARKLLDAAWRYYNLADFAISRQDPKASAALRMAFEDAYTFLGSMMADPMWAAGANAKPTQPDEGKAIALLATVVSTIERFIADGTAVARAGGAKKFLPRR